jgi:ATP-dependent Clp protease ATP-binding subunit ClpC
MTYPRRHNFTERSHKVLELAHDVAKERGHGGISPVHLALGLLREGDGVAMTALRSHGIVPKTLEHELEEALAGTPVPAEPPAELSMTAGGEDLLTQARAEARALGHRYVGTEHLLLALMRDRDGSPARVLARQGLAFDEARARILWILTADPQNPAPFVAPTAV